ncbi:NnrU family protein [Aliiroseovarius sp. F20344]|uniref:NnrU family protein n=1 Tax=Aliiroseovarius sp. F20344 TaxID=2926414 RepID=UPI001FF18239|nr:NnrU family protein [Aliiroseovarius sp. F20344]MCK0143882.1 NnrU family protein [Aliiroseovarius sp. F20344]
MLDWLIYAVAILLFFLTHSIPVRPAIKSRIVAHLGGPSFTLAYSALSIAALTMVIIAANRAPFVELWPWAPWQNHVTLIAMAAAVLIASLAIGRPNALSFGGRNNDLFDPRAAGIVGWVRHPLLAALLLWSLGHLVPNGNLAHLILFGIFASFSALGKRIIDKRNQRLLGIDIWQQLANTKREITVTKSGVIRVFFGVVVYLLLIRYHSAIIGVTPLP